MFLAFHSSRSHTVGVLFAKMLMTIKGVSPHTASAIVALYPTVTHLLRAYDAQPDVKARDRMLQDIRVHKSRRLGPALSKKIAAIYNKL